MTESININILRISPDGQLLEFDFQCPLAYHLENFRINIDGQQDDKGSSIYYEIGQSLFTSDSESISGAVKVSNFNVTGPSIYHIHIVADPDSTTDNQGNYLDSISVDATISDVSNIYKCIIGDIIDLDAHCNDKTILDRIIRNYLMLYAHEEAMRLKYFDEAKDLFIKLNNCFGLCTADKRIGTNYSNCGCNKKYD